MNGYSIVIPTLARPSLHDCLSALARSWGPRPEKIVLVDDRPRGGPPLRVPGELACLTRVVASRGRGAPAARNRGWRETRTPWVVFLDEDVLVEEDWCAALAADLKKAEERTAAVQGNLTVLDRFTDSGRRSGKSARRPRAGSRRWTSADLACRRAALVESGGFDERLPRLFREDGELMLRLQADGWEPAMGERRSRRVARPVPAVAGIRVQAGADDALYGRDWHFSAGEHPDPRPHHLAVTATGLLAAGAALTGRRRLAALAALGALAEAGRSAAARNRPDRRGAREAALLLGAGLLIPAAASWQRAKGLVRSRDARSWPGPARALLLDRDAALAHGGSTARPLPGVREALDLARSRGLRLGVVAGRAAREDQAADPRLAELLGPLGTWQTGPHGADGALITRAAAELGVPVQDCLVVGDLACDVQDARAAGARSVLVPTARTREDDLTGARCASDLRAAVLFALGESPGERLWR